MYDPSGLYIDPVLSTFSVSLPMQQQYFGIRLMPETPVRTQSGLYRTYDRSDWTINEDRREPGTVAHEVVGFKWSTDTFNTHEHSLQVPIFDEERQQLYSMGGLADPVFGGVQILDPEQNAVDKIVRSIFIGHENRVATLLRNTANYPANNTVTLTGTAQWSDYTATTYPWTTSDPVADILKGMRAVYNATLRWPNTLAIPTQGLSYLEQHPRIVDRFKYFSLTQPGAFQAITGFEGQVVLLESMYNAANNFDATMNLQWFWGKDVWLGIVDPALTMNTQTFGKTFAQIYPDGSTRPTERWREESRKADIIRTNYKYDLKITTAGAGYLIKNAFGATAW